MKLAKKLLLIKNLQGVHVGGRQCLKANYKENIAK